MHKNSNKNTYRKLSIKAKMKNEFVCIQNLAKELSDRKNAQNPATNSNPLLPVGKEK